MREASRVVECLGIQSVGDRHAVLMEHTRTALLPSQRILASRGCLTTDLTLVDAAACDLFRRLLTPAAVVVTERRARPSVPMTERILVQRPARSPISHTVSPSLGI